MRWSWRQGGGGAPVLRPTRRPPSWQATDNRIFTVVPWNRRGDRDCAGGEYAGLACRYTRHWGRHRHRWHRGSRGTPRHPGPVAWGAFAGPHSRSPPPRHDNTVPTESPRHASHSSPRAGPEKAPQADGRARRVHSIPDQSTTSHGLRVVHVTPPAVAQRGGHPGLPARRSHSESPRPSRCSGAHRPARSRGRRGSRGSSPCAGR